VLKLRGEWCGWCGPQPKHSSRCRPSSIKLVLLAHQLQPARGSIWSDVVRFGQMRLVLPVRALRVHVWEERNARASRVRPLRMILLSLPKIINQLNQLSYARYS
jgi:hypothetical protein